MCYMNGNLACKLLHFHCNYVYGDYTNAISSPIGATCCSGENDVRTSPESGKSCTDYSRAAKQLTHLMARYTVSFQDMQTSRAVFFHRHVRLTALVFIELRPVPRFFALCSAPWKLPHGSWDNRTISPPPTCWNNKTYQTVSTRQSIAMAKRSRKERKKQKMAESKAAETALDALRQTLTLLASIAPDTGVPWLASASTTVSTLIALVQVSYGGQISRRLLTERRIIAIKS